MNPGDPGEPDETNENEAQHVADEGPDGLQLDPEDIQQVIDLDDNNEGELAVDIDDMDLQAPGEDGGAEGEAARDDAAVVFEKHKGSVFCVKLDQHGQTVAASGGEDDKAYVWQVEDGQELFECTGHKDSVTCVAFSHDGAYLASGDMSGLIKVWKVSTKKEVWSFEVSDLEWLDWHHAAHVLFAGTVDGEMWMWKIPSGDCKTFQGHGSSCSIGKITPDGKHACTGYEDGVVKVWDLKAGTPKHTFSGHNGHSGSILAMDCHHDNHLLATGSSDLTAKLLNTVNGKVLATFSCKLGSEEEEEENSVEAVGFSHVSPVVATGTLTGNLQVWDLSSQIQRTSCKHEAGIVRLSWSKTSPVLYTCTLDGIVHMWDSRTGNRERQWCGHNGEILDMDLSRNDNIIITGSDDKTARVFKLKDHPS